MRKSSSHAHPSSVRAKTPRLALPPLSPERVPTTSPIGARPSVRLAPRRWDQGEGQPRPTLGANDRTVTCSPPRTVTCCGTSAASITAGVNTPYGFAPRVRRSCRTAPGLWPGQLGHGVRHCPSDLGFVGVLQRDPPLRDRFFVRVRVGLVGADDSAGHAGEVLAIERARHPERSLDSSALLSISRPVRPCRGLVDIRPRGS